MDRVHLLDSRIANMIAAGEVVERPSGVVKELVENSIDAKSTRIEVHLLQGGIEKIEVIDNGIGMSRADARLAFQRHATSKISQADDLFNIHTLGFRGEALPSIASVSEVTMWTCDGEETTEIKINNGVEEHCKPCGHRVGTQVCVEHLFYTLPARLKHLKSIGYECNLALDIIQKLALANPQIAFLFTHEGKELFRSNGNNDMAAVMYAIYGRDVAKASIPLHAEDDDFLIDGYICLPSITRSNRNHIITFMNHRLIKSYRLQQACLNGYEAYIVEGRFPILALNITLSASLVDVNVHPSKWEVRLSKENQLYQLISASVATTLLEGLDRQGAIIGEKEIDKRVSKERTQNEQMELFSHEPKLIEVQTKLTNPVAFSYTSKVTSTNVLEEGKTIEKPISYQMESTSSVSIVAEPSELKKEIVENIAEFDEKTSEIVENEAINVENEVINVENSDENVEKSSKMPVPRVLGQLHGSFIIAESEEGLLIVDQHAANERIRFEEVVKQLESEEMKKQVLLFPLVITLKNDQMLFFEELHDALIEIGIEIETFGKNEIIIREMPLWVQVDDEASFVLDLIDNVLEDKKNDIAKLRKKALATIACHSSIRFNRVLSQLEMETTLERLLRCDNPYHCPHGRPTMIVYEDSKLRKLFDRG